MQVGYCLHRKEVAKGLRSWLSQDEEVDKSIEELLAVFNSLDVDATGSLSAEEVSKHKPFSVWLVVGGRCGLADTVSRLVRVY